MKFSDNTLPCTFLMKHIMMTFRKFRFYHPPTPSANKITKKYQGTFQNLPHPLFFKQKVPVYFSNFAKDLKTPPTWLLRAALESGLPCGFCGRKDTCNSLIQTTSRQNKKWHYQTVSDCMYTLSSINLRSPPPMHLPPTAL